MVTYTWKYSRFRLYSSANNLGIKCPLEYMSAGLGDYASFFTFYYFNPNN